MKRQYSSFLIRCWLLDGGEQRIKIEHVQSGETIQVATPTAAIAWIGSHWSSTQGANADNQNSHNSQSGEPLFEDEQHIPPGIYDS